MRHFFKIRRVLFIFTVLLFLPALCFSAFVPLDRAQQVAENYLKYYVTINGNWAGSNAPVIAGSEEVVYEDVLLAYNFAVSPKGHLLVPSWDEFSPIYLYSDTSEFFPERVGEANSFESWIIPELYKVYEFIKNNRATIGNKIVYEETRVAKAWDWLDKTKEGFSNTVAKFADRSAQVGPYLTTIWGQGSPYNQYTPGISGSCTHTLTGCVATAWAQVLKYWNWPGKGTGSHSYTWPGHGTLSAGFNHFYYWGNMPNDLTSSSTSAQKDAVARLMSDAGISANSNYGCGETGSNEYANDVLDVYFKYKSSMQKRSRTSYSSSAWFNLFKPDLDNRRPVILSIWTTTGGGHEAVVDGYETGATDKIHINYGWDGNWNGFYDVTSNWTASWTWNFTSQIIVTGIQPNGRPITSPLAGSKLSCGSQTFRWASGAYQYWLYAGSSEGKDDYYNSGSLGSSTSTVVTGLPNNGSTVYVRLYWQDSASAGWGREDYSYIACRDDVNVTSLWTVSGNLEPGGDAKLWANVTNKRSSTLPSTARVYYHVTGPSYDDYVGSVSVGGQTSNLSKWYDFIWQIPASAKPGTYQYWARVWDTAEGRWLGEWKCCQSFTVVAAQCSSVIESLWSVGTKYPGDTARLWAKVKNTGSTALPAGARVGYWVDGASGPNAIVGYRSVAGLAPGATVWYYYDWKIPTTHKPGTYNYWGRVFDGIFACSAWKGPQSFTVVAPKLAAEVTSLWPPGTTGCYGTAKLYALVKNTGSSTLPASARVYYYVSGPSFGNYVGSVSVGGLAPGEGGWFLVQWKVPYRGEQGTETYNYWARVYDTATSTWLGDWKGPQSFFNLCIR